VKRTIRLVDPLSVLKLSLFFYAVFLGVWMLFVAILYWILQGAGLFDTIEKLGGPNGFALWDSFGVSLFFIERWAFLIGLSLVVLGALVNVFLSVLYNVAADTIGGVEMTFVDRET
jgi:hypothetical protein